MNKRGMSPILSTFLLIFIAIAVGVLVMNWGRATLEENSKCAVTAGIKFVYMNQLPQVCYAGEGDKGALHFIIENGDRVPVEKVHMQVIGKKGVLEEDVADSSIEISGSTIQDVPYNFDKYGDIHQVKLSPMLVLYPQEPPLTCTEQALLAENIKPC